MVHTQNEGRYMEWYVHLSHYLLGCPCVLYKADQEELHDIRPLSLICSQRPNTLHPT